MPDEVIDSAPTWYHLPDGNLYQTTEPAPRWRIDLDGTEAIRHTGLLGATSGTHGGHTLIATILSSGVYLVLVW